MSSKCLVAYIYNDLLSRNVKSTIKNTNGRGDISKIDNETAYVDRIRCIDIE